MPEAACQAGPSYVGRRTRSTVIKTAPVAPSPPPRPASRSRDIAHLTPKQAPATPVRPLRTRARHTTANPPGSTHRLRSASPRERTTGAEPAGRCEHHPTPPEMAQGFDVAAFAAALTNTIREAFDNLNQQQVAQVQPEQQQQLIAAQIAALQNLAAAQGQVPRDHFIDLPRYGGNPNDLDDWLAWANRIKEDREVLDAVAVRECGSKLDGLAAEWQTQIGAANAVWEDWMARLRESFGRPLNVLEWQYLVETRTQLVGETVAAYVFDKTKLLRRCPLNQLAEAAYIPYLVRGLRNPEFRSPLSRDPPDTIDGLMRLISTMEAYQPATIAFLPATMPGVAPAAQPGFLYQPSAVNASAGQPNSAPLQLVPYGQANNWSAVTAPVPTAYRPRRPPRDVQFRDCYRCGRLGHIGRDCPGNERVQQGNAGAGPVGQDRP